jgi:hypothetical protein
MTQTKPSASKYPGKVKSSMEKNPVVATKNREENKKNFNPEKCERRMFAVPGAAVSGIINMPEKQGIKSTRIPLRN